MIIPKEYLKIDNKYIFPINDNTSWLTFPDFRIIYNKLFLSEIQNLESNPIPIIPNKFPIVIKPIINLSGMSKGFYKINNEKDYDNIVKEIKKNCTYYDVIEYTNSSGDVNDFVCYSCPQSKYKGKIGFMVYDGNGVIRHFPND